MPLPTSPSSISLNQIHVEAGGTSGTEASINDADIRALIGKASAAQMSFSEWYGAANVLSSVEIQPATRYAYLTGVRGSTYEHLMHGFGQAAMATYNSTMGTSDGLISDSDRNNAAQGSIINSPNLSKWGVSSTMGTLACIVHFTTGGFAGQSNVAMIVTGTGSNSNSGFTTLTATRSGMTTLALNRTDATYYYGSTGTARIWIWSSLSAGSSETTLTNYLTGTGYPPTYTNESVLFPGGNGSTTANTTTTSRSTWTIS